jgi:sulfatase maturation enzyme AslB (radical SAM superfamily)
MKPPEFLFLTLNESCNLRCRHCRYWTRTGSPGRIGLDRMAELVSEFAELSPAGKVVLCGGEPMLEPETYYGVCRAARDAGLRSLSVVNGTQVRNRDDADRVVREGPDEVSVSLDSPIAADHDRMRGVPGAHERACEAVRLLVSARTEARAAGGATACSMIDVMGLLCRSSYAHLPEFYELALEHLGADKLKLNALQPSFGRLDGEDVFFARESQVDPGVLDELLWSCDDQWSLGLNPAWVEQVVSYFRDLWRQEGLEAGWVGERQTTLHACNSGERNVVVDELGYAGLCFSSLFSRWELRDRGDVRKFWEDWSRDAREAMKNCNCLCGLSHSFRKEHATLGKAGISR